MATRIATGVASASGPDGYAEAAERAARGLDGARPDLVVVFAGPVDADPTEVDAGLAAVRARLPARALVGCGAQGVVGGGRELEEGGVSVWAASLPGAGLETFRLEAERAGEGGMSIHGMPDLETAEAVILLVDPYSFPVEPVLGRIGEDHPGLPVIGGLSSGGGGPGRAALFQDGGVARSGAVGVALSGVDVRPCVSQGARPIGPEMVVTAANGHEIAELASRPALERLKSAIAELEPEERALAAGGLVLGIVIDENKPDYERGDFLVRGLAGVDEEAGTLTVGERVRVGQTVRLQVRDGASADEDLREILQHRLGGLAGPPAGALLFTCNGRGTHMFGVPDHDATVLDDALGGAPAAGFFCAGEIGPVGPRNFLHGFTATLAVFPG